ncbi:hypothetical protein RND71_029830 [Anisodus tanguticus]|uniref:Uncharacterized protein n=1 Tax=Anisodus tanguticus TaxID=243964 RepID=A0AAE1RGK4_9SOLA|nr:hypothetical protein RND71_029830 [Anisodus tanguticus]
MDESINNKYKESLLQDEKSSSRTKRKLRLIICLLTLFTLIIAAIISTSIILKQKIESKSLSYYPTNAITSVCDLISEGSYSCFDSIATLYYSYESQSPISSWLNRDKINPSRVFILSLYASRIKLENVALSLEKTISEEHMSKSETVGILRNCKGMIKFSLKQLNESEISLGIDPDEKILEINKVVWDLQRWIGEAMGQVQRCVDSLEEIPSTVEIREQSYVVQNYMRNSREILRKVDDIFDLFYPRIGSALGSLVSEFEYGLAPSPHRRAQYPPEAHTDLARKWTHRRVNKDETRDVLAIRREALGHQESYMLAYNTSQDPTASNAEKVLAEKFSRINIESMNVASLGRYDVVADRKPDVLTTDMPSSSLHVVDPYYPVMNFDMSSSSMSGHEVPHYQTTTIVTLDGSFRKFASFEPLSFTGLAQRFIADLPAFSRHSSPTWRRLIFTDDAAETQVVVAQRRPKRERRATRCGTGGHRY